MRLAMSFMSCQLMEISIDTWRPTPGNGWTRSAGLNLVRSSLLRAGFRAFLCYRPDILTLFVSLVAYLIPVGTVRLILILILIIRYDVCVVKTPVWSRSQMPRVIPRIICNGKVACTINRSRSVRIQKRLLIQYNTDLSHIRNYIILGDKHSIAAIR